MFRIDAPPYQNHLERVNELLSHEPRSLPDIRLKRVPDWVEDFQYEDIELVGYEPCPVIEAPVAV